MAEQGLCGVCKAFDRRWSRHAIIRYQIEEIERALAGLKALALLEERSVEDEERTQWSIETYRGVTKELSHVLGALEELEAEYAELRPATSQALVPVGRPSGQCFFCERPAAGEARPYLFVEWVENGGTRIARSRKEPVCQGHFFALVPPLPSYWAPEKEWPRLGV